MHEILLGENDTRFPHVREWILEGVVYKAKELAKGLKRPKADQPGAVAVAIPQKPLMKGNPIHGYSAGASVAFGGKLRAGLTLEMHDKNVNMLTKNDNVLKESEKWCRSSCAEAHLLFQLGKNISFALIAVVNPSKFGEDGKAFDGYVIPPCSQCSAWMSQTTCIWITQDDYGAVRLHCSKESTLQGMITAVALSKGWESPKAPVLDDFPVLSKALFEK